MYAADVVQSLPYMRHTRTTSSVPYGNENWISKPFDTSFLPIGRMVQTITNPTLGSMNSCVLTQPRARSPAPKVNATFRVPTDSLLTTSTAPAFYSLPCLSEFPFGTIPLMVPGGLVKSSNPPTSSDATSYGSSTTQALPRSTSQNPSIIRCSTPPVAPGASKHTAAPTRFKASYMVNHPTFHAPLRRRITTVHILPETKTIMSAPKTKRPRGLCPCPRQAHLRPRRLYLRPRQLYLRRRRLCLQAILYIFSSAPSGKFEMRRFCSLSLCQTFAVLTHVVFLRRTSRSAYCDLKPL